MKSPLRLLIHGAQGRMGKALIALCADDANDCRVVAAVAREVGQRVVDGVPQFSASELTSAPEFDVAIDFSLPTAFDDVLALCVDRKAALVSGTTGLNAVQMMALQSAGIHIPIAWSANFSLGIAVLNELVARAASALPEWDCDVVEAHHTQKQDAPSGTALLLGETAKSAGAVPRYASIRAGDIVGEHLVQFTSSGERIELIHRASNRAIFARGALHAAAKLILRPAGVYTLRDLLD